MRSTARNEGGARMQILNNEVMIKTAITVSIIA